MSLNHFYRALCAKVFEILFIFDFWFGHPLPAAEERGERIGPTKGIRIFGLDALSSAAYGPEAAGAAYIVLISASIIALLAIVYFSYRQTIDSYPGGGGS
jgi:hypothetical protein